MIADGDFTPEWVASQLPPLLADTQRLRDMGRAAWSYGIRDAAEVMARRILELVDQRHGRR
jgi:UDP-N-acetylglucosamine--N-acetylmuramyl-(pentapeptide) pyrophosphoryl-undecaprenol N-acetylglucosamine transferase